jgi:hypothetical protein
LRARTGGAEDDDLALGVGSDREAARSGAEGLLGGAEEAVHRAGRSVERDVRSRSDARIV